MYASFGKTTTPKLGWGCCTLPPCCEKDKIYWSDNNKTWGATSTIERCCGCCTPKALDGVQVLPNGNQYRYDFETPCCGNPVVTVSRGGSEVGRVEQMCYLCPCDKVARNGTRDGKSIYTTRFPSCCGACCPGGGGCCGPSRGCCDPWKRYDIDWIRGPEAAGPGVVATVTNQYHGCCPMCYPAWTGFDVVPTHDEDDMAILGAFIWGYPLYSRGLVNTAPATLGGVV